MRRYIDESTFMYTCIFFRVPTEGKMPDPLFYNIQL